MSLPWLKALDEKNRMAVGTTVTKTNKKRNKQYKDVIYPAFMQCADLTSDENWKRLFEDLAHGVPYKGFSIRNRSLAYTNGNKTTTIRMDLEPSVLQEKIMDLVSSCRGLIKRTGEEVKIAPSEVPEDWRLINMKACKKNYILRCIARQAQEQGLDDEETKSACRTVLIWMQQGSIRMPGIIMKNGEIVSIPGVVVTKDGVQLTSPPPSTRTKAPLKKIHISRLYCKTSQYLVKSKTVSACEEDEEVSSTA